MLTNKPTNQQTNTTDCNSQQLLVKMRKFVVDIIRCSDIGVGTAGAMGAFASTMLKLRGRKYLFFPAIICQVYLLVDS